MFFSKREFLFHGMCFCSVFFYVTGEIYSYSHLFVHVHPFFSDEGSQQSLSLVQECVVRNTKAVKPWGVQMPLNHVEYKGHWTI